MSSRRRRDLLRTLAIVLVLVAVLAEVSSHGNLAGLPKLLDVADIATDHVKTDDAMSTGTAMGLARRLRNLGPASIDMRVYPSVASPPRCAGCAAFVDPLPEAAVLMRALARGAATLPPVGLPAGPGPPGPAAGRRPRRQGEAGQGGRRGQPGPDRRVRVPARVGSRGPAPPT
jgi:hypothetical protein